MIEKPLITPTYGMQFGCYSILDHIGEGSFGQVALASKDSQLFAIKFCSNKYHNSKVGVELLRKESQLLKGLKHPNIIRLEQTFTDENQQSTDQNLTKAAIVLEYAPNNLIDMIIHAPFPEHVARSVFKQMLDAVCHLHRNLILHRDIKPQNVLFDEAYTLKLCDFGLSVSAKESVTWGKTCGTNGFMTPEMLYGEKDQLNGIVNDIFATGVTLFMLVTGKAPFVKANPAQPPYSLLARNKPQEFWKLFEEGIQYSNNFKNLIQSMLSLDPTCRLSIAEIYGHPWFEEQSVSREGYLAYMHKIKQTLVTDFQPPKPDQTQTMEEENRCVQVDPELIKPPYQQKTTRLTDFQIKSLRSLEAVRLMFRPLNAELIVEGSLLTLVTVALKSKRKLVIGLAIFAVDIQTDCIRLALREGEIDDFVEFISRFKKLIGRDL